MDIKIDFKTLQDSENVAELLDEEQLRHVGGKVVEWYTMDKESRASWEKSTQNALKLALQAMENKSYPWQNASNVKFPLLTIAALQFSARVYPALVTTPDLVKYRVMGLDPQGQKAARASRVSKFMSYQLLEENESWEEEQDKLFIALPILGCMFKKTYYDALSDQVRSRLVLPQDLILHYWTKDLEKSRVTETFELYAREIRERQLRGLYLDTDITQFGQGNISQKDEVLETDSRQGIHNPMADDDTPRQVLECHCFFDFDGDGYDEPYVITVDRESRLPLRILNRFQSIVSEQSLAIERLQKQNFLIAQSLPTQEEFQQLDPRQKQMVMTKMREADIQVQANQKKIEELGAEPPKIIRILPKVYYTKYSFIPAPDGGYYDIGFGQLLGPLNASVNTLINQLVDAGTMQNGSSGFIGKGARIQGGTTRFEPYEWKRVSVAGSTLKESIVPLPINAPSNVLFELLGLLINYSERVSSVSDVMSGQNPGQNTPAFNMQAMLEQGMQVFNGVFKRIYRSFRSELRKIYLLNSEYLDAERYVETMDAEYRLLQTDFGGDPKDLVPAADPNAFSNMEKLAKAQFLAQRAAMTPGYNPVVVERRLLEAMDIADSQEIFPLTPEGQLAIPPAPNPELEIEKADMQRRTIEGRVRGEVDAAKADADIALKEAQALKIMVELGSITEEHAMKRMEAIQKQFEFDQERIQKLLDLYMQEGELKKMDKELELMDKKITEAEVKANAQKNTTRKSD